MKKMIISINVGIYKRHFIINAVSNKIIEFMYDKTLKRSNKFRNNVFDQNLPERIQLQPGEFKKVDMKLFKIN